MLLTINSTNTAIMMDFLISILAKICAFFLVVGVFSFFVMFLRFVYAICFRGEWKNIRLRHPY